MRFFFFSLLLAAVLFVADLYVFRNWRRFARYRRWNIRWTLPAYHVLLFVMPLALPAYLYFSRWWAVEPKLLRAAFIGIWAVYYLPKLPVIAVLLLKDFSKFVTWLFRWFQRRTHVPVPAGGAPEEAVLEDAAPALDLTDMKRMSRGEFLQRLGWSAASIPFVVVGYGVFRTLYDFEVLRTDVPVAGLPPAFDGLTIAQISDLHAGSFFSARPMEEAVELINRARPDLIAITGDFVNHDVAELAVIGPALRALKADLGVYGCLGNHDHYARVQDVVAAVRATPVDLLVNENRSLRIDGARLHVIGTDNTGFNQHYADLPRALAGLPPEEEDPAFRLLLAHDPTFWDHHVRPRHAGIDLMLCGHTHGGQIGFEMGPLRWGLARIAYRRWAGLYSEPRPAGDRHFLYVNRGLGTVGPPLRIGIRPEITLLTLRRA